MVEVPAYSDHYALHPSKIIVSNVGMYQMKPHMDRFTGNSAADMTDRKVELFKTREYELALERRKLILDQLMKMTDVGCMSVPAMP